MKIQANQETLDSIKDLIEQQEAQPEYIRVYIAGMGCGGPSFGLTLDEFNKEEDLMDDVNDIKFIMTKEAFDQVGDILIDQSGNGYIVKPVKKGESACGGCSGSCG